MPEEDTVGQRKNDAFGVTDEKRFRQLVASTMTYPNGQMSLDLRAIGGGEQSVQIVGRVDELVAELKRVVAWLEGETPSA
jgi:hypothetical protein